MNDNREHESGYCVVCGSRSSFRFDPTIITPQLQKAWSISDNLVEAFNRKESMFCDNCGSSLRIRRLAGVLIQTFSEINRTSYKSFVELLADREFRRLKIAEINACAALHTYLKEHPNLYYSEWMSNINQGEIHEGIRCEDLQCLTYPDDYFDIILTSETLEHVPEPDRAWREIYRTLKSEGYHIFTVPIIPWQRDTIQRTRLVSGIREDLSEPAYHGEWGRQDVFVYTDFGIDIVEKLNKIGLNTEVFYMSPQVDLDVAVVFRSQKTGGLGAVAVKGGSPLLKWTGERYVPWLEEAVIGYEHLHRYAYATQLVQDKRVLDLACGEGYGSYLLAKAAESVVGIDIDENSVKHARNKYIKHNLEFKVGSITEVPIAGAHLFDVAVCFEALEHIEDHHKLLSEVKRLLTPDGVFIVSTPNKTVYTDEPQYNNPFHVHELYFDEFRELFERHFKNVKFLGQRIYCNSNIWPVFPDADTKVVEYVIDRNPKEFVFVENDKRIPLYFVALASDAACDITAAGSALIDVSDALLKQKDGQIAAHVREQERLSQEIEGFHQEIEGFQTSLHQKEEQVIRLRAEQERLSQEVVQLQAAVQSQQSALEGKEREVALAALDGECLAHKLGEFQATIRQQEIDLGMVYNSLGWMVTSKFRRAKDKFLTPGTRRRKLYDLILAAVKGRLNNKRASVVNETYLARGDIEPRASYEQQPFLSDPFHSKPVTIPVAGSRAETALEAGHQRFCLYASSLGNYFFLEIRELLASGFRELGFEVNLRDERDGFAEEADWHVVVAPHEFFHLGVGEALHNERTPSNLILLNTEQPSTQWFSRAYSCFSKAFRIWDIEYQSSHVISKEGFVCRHLPLGYVSDFRLFQEVKELPEHYGTCFLKQEIRKQSYLHRPLADRPIDLLFLGTLSQRREKFFALAAPVLSDYLCYLYLPEAQTPLICGLNTDIDTATSVGLAQRSKILLNIHRGADIYFEWHRIVMHGIWNKALVISEPCGDTPLFRPGVDFVEAPLEKIPEILIYYLSDFKGQAEAQEIALRGFRTLSEQSKLTDFLRPLILELHVRNSQAGLSAASTLTKSAPL